MLQIVYRQFFDDENGKFETIEITCLKPKVGAGTTLEVKPNHLLDIGMFKVYNVITGPFEVKSH